MLLCEKKQSVDVEGKRLIRPATTLAGALVEDAKDPCFVTTPSIPPSSSSPQHTYNKLQQYIGELFLVRSTAKMHPALVILISVVAVQSIAALGKDRLQDIVSVMPNANLHSYCVVTSY